MLALSVVLAEQEGENLSGLSDNPDKAIFAVRENSTTCLMVEFAVKFLVPYDVLALNGIDVRNPRNEEENRDSSAQKLPPKCVIQQFDAQAQLKKMTKTLEIVLINSNQMKFSIKSQPKNCFFLLSE